MNPLWRTLPLALTLLRVLLAPVLLYLGWYFPHPAAFFVCLLLAFLSDVFDGVLARRLHVATAGLRRLDSVADSVFYLCALLVIDHLYPQALLQRQGLLYALFALELSRYLLDWYKFGKEASYHLWSSKCWGVCLFAGCLSLLVFANDGLWVTLAISVGIVADIEGLLISLLLPYWQHDVPSLWHAWRLRTAR